MSYRRVNTGDPLILRVRLFTGDSAQFPLARIYDSTETALGSPVALVPGAIPGRYYAVGPVLGNGEYSADYVVYSDSGHTTESPSYANVTDDFDVRPASSFGSSSMLSATLQQSALSATISNPEISATVIETETVV